MRFSRLAGSSAVLLAVGLVAAGCGGFDIGAGDVAVFRVGYAEATQSDGCYPNDEPPPDEGDASTLRSGQTMIIFASAAEDAEPTYYLDAGGLVLEGAQGEDGAYSFAGLDKDVQGTGGGFIVDADHDGQDDFNGDTFVDADNDSVNDQNGDDPEVDADNDTMDDRFGDDFVDTNNDGAHDYDPIELPADSFLTSTTEYSASMVVTDEGVEGTFASTTSVECSGPACAGLPKDEACKQTTKFVGVWVEDASIDVSMSGGNQGP